MWVNKHRGAYLELYGKQFYMVFASILLPDSQYDILYTGYNNTDLYNVDQRLPQYTPVIEMYVYIGRIHTEFSVALRAI